MENKETLASALCKAQSEFTPAAQSGYNPHFKSSFSTMTDLIRATRPALKKYGIAVMQHPSILNGNLVLDTTIALGDDELTSQTPIILKDPSDMQAFGKACSYITRYVYKMMLGIEAADEDDDGNASANLPNGNSPRSNTATEAQVKFLSQLLAGKDDIKNAILKAENVTELSQLSFDIVSKSITKLKSN